ncbi:MAG: carbon starvation protein A [Bacteroidaceae bacterium]|nr:carbon starvation protein A [Bacteroidaceae bacterium]
MITFLICLAALITAYFTYGKYLENVCDINEKNPVPSKTLYDGVDYLPMPRWKIFLIQLLNIAGLGPIFGALLGAAYGPIAFLWITLGGIFMGAMHDFTAGVISLKNSGLSLPEIIGKYLGNGTKLFMRVFSVLLMVLVGAVFISQPAELIASNISLPALEVTAFNGVSWELFIVLMTILAYYMLATVMPIDKIIGRLYPIFGLALIIMAFSLLGVLIFNSDTYPIPELTSLRNGIADPEKFPIIPMLFTTIACGALSGFHATQSPLMARCMTSEKQSRPIFYGAMISESIIALIWAAIAMAFWGGVEGLNNAIAQNGGSAAKLVNIITETTLGHSMATAVVFGIIACAITSGDTAFRCARLIVTDILGISQRSIIKRLAVSLPLFVGGLFIIFALPFQTIWSYFAWTNQTLAVITLWCITVYLSRKRKPLAIGAIPALIMTYVCSSYIFVSPMMCGMENRLHAYLLGAILTIAIAFAVWINERNLRKKNL